MCSRLAKKRLADCEHFVLGLYHYSGIEKEEEGVEGGGKEGEGFVALHLTLSLP